jgi:FkbM family methyltransferase
MILAHLRKAVKKILPAYKYSKTAYAQEGEDMMVNRFFEFQKKGVYVDVGAHHPFRFSNTCFFYRKGWSGINIDPLPEVVPLFKKYRKRDVNIQKGVSLKQEQLLYYSFNEPAYNTFSEAKANEYISAGLGLPLLKKIKIDTLPLHMILDEHLPAGTAIDFLSIDTEGLEMEVLQSNNWEKYRPTIIIIEDHTVEIKKHFTSELNIFMEQKNYVLVGKSHYSYIYKKN